MFVVMMSPLAVESLGEILHTRQLAGAGSIREIGRELLQLACRGGIAG